MRVSIEDGKFSHIGVPPPVRLSTDAVRQVPYTVADPFGSPIRSVLADS